MALVDLIGQDMKTAMKNKDKDRLNAIRAIKSELLLQKTKDPSVEITEADEIKILQMCQSPYVTQYLDAHLCSERRTNDRFWIVLEFCDMGSLVDLINSAWEKDGRTGSLSEKTIKLIATFILLGESACRNLVSVCQERAMTCRTCCCCCCCCRCRSSRSRISAQ